MMELIPTVYCDNVPCPQGAAPEWFEPAKGKKPARWTAPYGWFDMEVTRVGSGVYRVTACSLACVRGALEDRCFDRD